MTAIATWGTAGANSYVDHTGANSILSTTVINFDAWTDSTTVMRSAALIQATRDIDAFQWLGTRYYFDQNLEFPRQLTSSFPWNYTSSTGSGSILDDIEQFRMKDRVEQACALQALTLLRNGGTNTDLENQANGVQGFSETLGPMSQSVQYRTGGNAASYARSAQARLDPQAMALLSDYKASKKIYRA